MIFKSLTNMASLKKELRTIILNYETNLTIITKYDKTINPHKKNY